MRAIKWLLLVASGPSSLFTESDTKYIRHETQDKTVKEKGQHRVRTTVKWENIDFRSCIALINIFRWHRI